MTRKRVDYFIIPSASKRHKSVHAINNNKAAAITAYSVEHSKKRKEEQFFGGGVGGLKRAA